MVDGKDRSAPAAPPTADERHRPGLLGTSGRDQAITSGAALSASRVRPSGIAVAGGAALLLLTALTLFVGPTVVAKATADIGQLVAAVTASAACWRTSRSTSGRMRRSWTAISIGCAAWATGEAVWTVLDRVYAGREVPYPSLADIGFLLFPVGAIACLLLFPPVGGRRTTYRTVLDGCALLAALLAIYWTLAGTTLVTASRNGELDGLRLLATVAYPVGDILIIGLAFVSVSRPTRHRLPLALLAGGVSAMALADAGFALFANDYSTGGYRTSAGSPPSCSWPTPPRRVAGCWPSTGPPASARRRANHPAPACCRTFLLLSPP